jgi:hypothetical protein
MDAPARLDLSSQDVTVLEAVFSRFRLSKDEADEWHGDEDCIADDCQLAHDVVCDTLADLAYLGLVAQMPDGCYVPTMRAERYRRAELLVPTM